MSSQIVIEVIPSDNAFAEDYLQRTLEKRNVVARRQAIHEGTIDANAG